MGVYLRMTPAMRAVLHHFIKCDSETWGLQLANAIRYPTGTIYPILERLEREGFIVSHWDDDETVRGARRRLYTMTEQGRQWAEMQLIHKGQTQGGVR
jgi:DNA-binding PadR family transcriptional regulator